MPVEKLSDLLQEKAFVDYFNMFLSQPIFGFKLLYHFKEKKFAVNSKFKRVMEKMTNSKLLTWLESKRLPLFIQSSMYYEYKLCKQLREIKLNKEAFVHTCDVGHLDETLIKVIVENIFGHFAGMQQFKKFLIETNGEKIWQCIKDVMSYCNRKLSDKLMRYELHNLIIKYLANGTLFELSSRMKLYLFLESDPLENPSMENAALNYGVCFDNCLFYKEMLRNEPDKAMLRFYSFLVQDLLTYWAPCFVLHLLQQRISFGLECLCTLSFTETPGSLINILNLFDFTANNCPLFISEQRYNHSYFPKDSKQKRSKLPFNTQEYLFGDGDICETLDHMNHKMMIILASDKLSGYPFLRFIMQTEESNGDQVYLLWEDLCKYITMRKNDNEYVKKLQEGKIKTMYLLKERISQDDLLDNVIKHIVQAGFKMADSEEKGKNTKLFKATDMTTDILEKLWQKYIDFEKNNMETDFELEPSDDADDCISLFDEDDDSSDFIDQAIMVDFCLTCFDIKQLRNGLSYSNNVLSLLFNEEEQYRIFLGTLENKRAYHLGKHIMKSLQNQKFKKRGKRVKPHRPKPRVPARIFKKDGPCSIKLVSEIKSKMRIIACDQKQKERIRIRNFGVNPYLSLRQEGLTFAAVDSNMRKKIVFQKYLRKLCYFIHEMLQPHMKELLTTYVDVLIKDAEFLTSKETNPVKKHQKYKRKQPIHHVSSFKPLPIFYERLKKKIIYLAESLQFKKSAYMMLASCKRTKINLHLKNKARRIINTFLEGALFSETRNNFVFGTSKDRTEDIINDTAIKLKLEGASCGLFHKLDVHVIPAVYQIWKKMGLDCIKCEGRGKFLAALGIDKEAFDKKYAKPMKVKAFEKSEKTVPDSRLKKSQLEEQASQMTKSLQALVDDDGFWKYRRQFAYGIGECISPDLRKLIQTRGGSQLEYVLVQ